MLIERKYNDRTNVVELWSYEWENPESGSTKKRLISKLGEEQKLKPQGKSNWSQEKAICWASGRTLGNIAVFSDAIRGNFPGQEGSDATLPCDFVSAGKFRHGAERWWCRTHQTHWGTKADIKAASQQGKMYCANHWQPMNYTLNPYEINVSDYKEVGIWCSLPVAISTKGTKHRAPKIHVHLRSSTSGEKVVDRDFNAISLIYHENLDLFANSEITRVNITPPAAFEFVCALEEQREMTCINCTQCGHPHLDLGDFARKPHRKHFCGNCGCDSTWSKDPVISTPLMPLYEQFTKNRSFWKPDRVLNLDSDSYQNCDYELWASTPAILWSANRPQETGIHAHVYQGSKRIVDNTFGRVVLRGEELQRADLLQAMRDRTII